MPDTDKREEKKKDWPLLLRVWHRTVVLGALITLRGYGSVQCG